MKSKSNLKKGEHKRAMPEGTYRTQEEADRAAISILRRGLYRLTVEHAAGPAEDGRWQYRYDVDDTFRTEIAHAFSWLDDLEDSI